MGRRLGKLAGLAAVALLVLLAVASSASARYVFGNNGCLKSDYEPELFVFACGDGKLRFETAEWTVWNGREGVAVGALQHPDKTAPGTCQRTILACPWVESAATLRFWRPVRCKSTTSWQFTRLRMEAPEDIDPEVRVIARQFKCSEYAPYRPPREPRPFYRECPNQPYPLENGTLERHSLSCRKARKLISEFMGMAMTYGVTSGSVDGFHCKNVPPAIRPGLSCAKGAHHARFLGYPPT